MRSLLSSLPSPDPFLLGNLCSRNGRGYPDISAQALDCEYIHDGEMYYGDGTTCAVSVRLSLFPAASALPRPFSSPRLTANIQIVAGIVSLINDFRIFHGGTTLGFFNDLLYSHEVSGIKDIIFGGNPGCNTDGFVAAPGWDPVRPIPLVSSRTTCIFSESFSMLADFVLYTRPRV